MIMFPVPLHRVARSLTLVRIALDNQITLRLDDSKELRHRVENQHIEKEMPWKGPRHRLGNKVERSPKRTHRFGYQPNEETQLRLRLPVPDPHLRQVGKGDIRA